MASSSSSPTYCCPLCQDFVLPTYKMWLSHLRHVHSHDSNFFVTCGVDCCPSTFRVFSTLYSHVYRRHRYMLERREKGTNDSVDDSVGSFESSGSLLQESTSSEDHVTADIQRLMGTDIEGVRRQSALFILKMKEKKLLTQSALDEMIDETTLIFDRTFNMLKAGIREKLAAAGVDLEMESVFKELSDPFNGLKSKYFQEKYFKESLGLIEPEEIKVGCGYDGYQFSGTKRRRVERYDTYHYIPLLKTLEALLNDSSVIEEIENCSGRIRTDGRCEDFCDGTVFKQHPLFSSDSKHLQIIAYYDELEIVNPLGSYVKKHKIGVVLFILGNIQPKLRSRLRAINLALVCKATLIEKYGMNEILKPFVRDLNILSATGVTVSTNGTNCVYKGSLLAILSDTQASQLLGGFKKSVSAFRMCRTCMASRDTFQNSFNSNDFQLRTTETHKRQCEKLTGPHSEHYSMVYGVNEKSILLDVSGYAMLNWGLPHDLMHDLFEGVVEYEIKLLLLHCCGQNYFSVTDFNLKLIEFDYGHSETADKPIPITSKHLRSAAKHLRQGSAQTWLLARILPLLVGSNVPESDKSWQCFIKLLRIIDFCTAPLLSPDNCGVLKLLIEEHHTMFVTLYPEWSILPKMHFMTHYPEQIMALGPLVRSWTMRHEAKLHLLKCAGKCSNFKNISQTISERHQRLMCYDLASGKILSYPTECGPSVNSSMVLQDEPSHLKDKVFSLVPGISGDVIVNRTSWTKINGLTYKTSGTYVLWKVNSADLAEPTLCFGLIEEILMVGSTLTIFVLNSYRSEYFDNHFHAYVVSPSSERAIVLYDNLVDHSILHCREISGKLYISMKYYIEF